MKLTPTPPISPLIKAFYLGATKEGKSGSLVPLAISGPIQSCAVPGPGLDLFVLDFDGKFPEMAYAVLDSMRDQKKITPSQRDEALARIDTTPCRENTGIVTVKHPSGTTIQTTGVKGSPTGWSTAIKQLEKWQSLFTPRSVLIIDSLTHAVATIINFTQSLNGQLNWELAWTPHGSAYMAPQQLVDKFMTALADMKANVIVCAHWTLQDVTKPIPGVLSNDGSPKEELLDVITVPVSVGRARSMALPSQFNHCLIAASEGSGSASRRFLHTRPVKGLAAASPFFSALPKYPIETGWVEYFALRANTPAT